VLRLERYEKEANMTRGISLHVGVNFTEVGSTPLLGCVNDAKEMACIAEQYGFEGREVVVDRDALLDTVMDKIKDAATRLVSGDIFFFTFSGHGSFVPDQNGDEYDFRDETLVLYDFMLSDDVLARDLWPRFAAGVRILMVSDSCSSGSVSARLVPRKDDDRKEEEVADEKRRTLTRGDLLIRDVKSGTMKTISEAERVRHLARNRLFYEKIFKNLPENPTVGASVLLIAACEDFDTTADGFPNCVFTQTLLDVVRGARPPSDYTQLVADVAALLVSTQVPQLTPSGASNPAFIAQTPFTID
jgi:hypothetical protein